MNAPKQTWWTGIEPHMPALRAAVEHIEAGNPDHARAALDELAGRLDLERTSDQLAYLLAAGLQAKATSEGREAANLYLRGFDVPHLNLYHLLRKSDPLVQAAHPIANAVVAELLGDAERATIIDLGTGDGAQLSRLLGLLGERGKLRALTIVAVDLGAEELMATSERMAKVAAAARIDLTFVPVPSMLEDIDAGTWAMMATTPSPRVVNASFSLHHMRAREGRGDPREEIFDRLHALAPAGLVMCEPCADFNVPDLRRRFRNTARWFGEMFDHLDELDIDVEDRRSLKFAFWGREILDVLGGSEEGRCERYEPPHRWVSRLYHAGFKPYRALDGVRGVRQTAASQSFNDGYIGLGTSTETLLAVIAVTHGEPVIDNAHAAARQERVAIAKPERIDIDAYLRLLVAIAFADGVVHDLERAFIDRQAAIHGIDPQTLWKQGATDIAALDRLDASTSRTTRRSVIRDCILLSHIDGVYDASERAAVRAAAARLQIDDATLTALEAEASGCAPPLLTDVPGWLREHWALLNKTS